MLFEAGDFERAKQSLDASAGGPFSNQALLAGGLGGRIGQQ